MEKTLSCDIKITHANIIKGRASTDFQRIFLMGLAGALMFVALVLTKGAGAADRPDSFADLAERLSPAVVNISTSMLIKDDGGPSLPQFPEGSPFEEFFKEFEDRGQARRTQSLGSGFIIDESGIVVTNNHVIENADKISVILSNDESFEATLVGRDQKTDIAVLKFDPGKTKLTAVAFGDSDKLRVGDWVIAIGNPFGLGGTVTAGIVSARGRDIGSGPYDDFIQTDASINRGNSGGPLFDLEGNVIGINTAIFSQSGGSVGIGFAISANLATQVVEQLQEFGRTRRGWLGVFIQEVTEDIAESLGLASASGALVASVSENGPADKAGLQAGDVIMTFDGKTVEESRDLPRIVAETAVEKTVMVELIRDGEVLIKEVTLGELEQAESGGLITGKADSDAPETLEDIGVAIAPLDAETAKRFNLEADENAVVVVKVKENGPAAMRGIEEGDIIRRINQVAVTSVTQLANKVREAKQNGRKGVLMLIESNGQTRFVQVGFETE